MARYIPTITTDIRGKLSGIVFSRSRASATIRSRVYPLHPSGWGTAYNVTLLLDANTVWQSFGADDNVAWTIYAAHLAFYLGINPDTLRVATLTYFTGCWSNAQLIGTFPVPLPDEVLMITPAPDSILITLEAGVLSATIGQASGFEGTPWSLYLDISAKNLTDTPLTTGGSIMGAADTATTIDITAAYVAAFGQLPTPGQVLFARACGLMPSAFYNVSELDVTIIVE